MGSITEFSTTFGSHLTKESAIAFLIVVRLGNGIDPSTVKMSTPCISMSVKENRDLEGSVGSVEITDGLS